MLVRDRVTRPDFFFLISYVVSLLYGSFAKVPCRTLAITNQQMLGEKRALFVDLFMAHMLRAVTSRTHWHAVSTHHFSHIELF